MRQLAILLLLCLTACSSVQIMTDYNPAADFSKYKTFGFNDMMPSDNAPIIFNQINQDRFKQAITTQMNAHNYTASATPDLKITVYLRVKDMQRVVNHQPNYYRNPYYYGAYSGYDYGWVSTVDYQEGTLVIDLVDVKANKLVWQGVARGEVQEEPKNVGEKIDRVVQKIFAKYPYMAGSGQRMEKK